MSIIVSLTTTSSRLEIARYALISIQYQDVQPDQIYLNISSEPYLYDEGISKLPEWLVEIGKQNVHVNWTANTGSYRKLLPVISKIDEADILVTCDDDVLYGRQWLKSLLDEAEKYPDCIVCAQARRPVKNIFGRTQSYMKWINVREADSGISLLPIGFAGIAYRKNLLDLDFLLWPEYLKAAPKQDDLWFKMASLRKGTNVRVVPWQENLTTPIKLKRSLSATNSKRILLRNHKIGILAFFLRRISNVLAYAGFDVCGNDKAWTAIHKASVKFSNNCHQKGP